MKGRITAAVAAASFVGVALSGCGVSLLNDLPAASTTTTASTAAETSIDDGPEQARLIGVADSCLVGRAIADGGTSLLLDTGYADDEVSMEELACVLVALDTPEYVIDHIESTRALDGQQTAEWGDFSARWTYHPDSGIQMSLIDKSRL